MSDNFTTDAEKASYGIGLQMGEQLSMTPAEFLPSISWLGMYPTWETFIGQSILLAAFVFGVIYTFIITIIPITIVKSL